MKKQQLYFRDEDSEFCHNKEYFLRELKENEQSEIEFFEAVPYIDDDHFWCSENCVPVERFDNPCGSECKDYKPRNGKSGCCKHYRNGMYEWGDKVILKLKEETK